MIDLYWEQAEDLELGFELPTQEMAASWIDKIQQQLKIETPMNLAVRIVSAAESQQLNHQFRGKDKATNVLSFPFEQPPEIEDMPEVDAYLGDLAICAAVVKNEAIEQGKAEFDHWAHMVIHGTLHLLGYDHIESDQAEQMEALERQLLAQLNINDPYEVK